MGQAKITGVENASIGKYTIELIKHPGRSTARSPAIAKELLDLTPQIVTQTETVATAMTALDAAMNNLDTAISQMQPGEPSDGVVLATKNVVTCQEAYRQAKRGLNDLNFKHDRLVAEQDMLTVAMAIESRVVWCADKTTTLTVNKTVGTIEINGEELQILLKPGGAIAGALGLLQSVGVSSPEATFWNWSLMPGWQKWKPTYRIGTIINVDYDNNTCDVALDLAYSGVQV